MLTRSITGLPSGIVFQAPGTETGQRASAPEDVFIEVAVQPSQDVAVSGDVGTAFAATSSNGLAQSSGRWATVTGLFSRVTGSGRARASGIEPTLTSERAAKRVVALLDEGNELEIRHQEVANRVFNEGLRHTEEWPTPNVAPTLLLRAIGNYREAIELMWNNQIVHVDFHGRSVSVANIHMKIGSCYSGFDNERMAEGYLNAHDEYRSQGKLVDATYALYRRQASFSPSSHTIEALNMKQDRPQVFRALNRAHAKLYKDFFAAYFRLAKPEQDQFRKLGPNLDISWHLEWFAEVLVNAELYDEAIELYGVLAGIMTGRAEEIVRIMADPAQREAAVKGSFLGALGISCAIRDNHEGALKFVKERVRLLDLMGRYAQIAQEMAPIVFLYFEAKDHSCFNLVKKFADDHLEFAEIALTNAAAGARSAGKHGFASEFEKWRVGYYSSKGDHAGLAEAYRLMAYDAAHESISQYDMEEPRGTEIYSRMSWMRSTAEYLEHYAEELIATGESSENATVVEARARAQKLRDFCEKRSGIEIVWGANGVATLAPLAGIRTFLGISDAIVPSTSGGFWSAIVRSRLPE